MEDVLLRRPIELRHGHDAGERVLDGGDEIGVVGAEVVGRLHFERGHVGVLLHVAAVVEDVGVGRIAGTQLAADEHLVSERADDEAVELHVRHGGAPVEIGPAERDAAVVLDRHDGVPDPETVQVVVGDRREALVPAAHAGVAAVNETESDERNEG